MPFENALEHKSPHKIKLDEINTMEAPPLKESLNRSSSCCLWCAKHMDCDKKCKKRKKDQSCDTCEDTCLDFVKE